ncbi:hypothetical protein Pint_27412 [Pistacia integerrima]|uniref:Uncharacterized protein n=1 Tax=Pistacia integerrima TaxID=434235 RepID=A0ACC0YSJ2_9ROSI|nr:hypothetical protein Pint_27412 [Pistacia integerrima]
MATFSYDFLYFSFFIFFIVLLPSAASLGFRLSGFDPNDNRILYQGDAVASVGTVALNFRDTYTCRVGWATYAERVPLWNPETQELSDFTTKFSFIIDTQGSSQYGSGLAFFLAPVGFQIPPNSAGGFLGLFNTTTAYSSSNQIVMVESDSNWNAEWDPPDLPEQDHVGINNNSIASAVYTRWNASFHSPDTADVQITYNATTKNLSVSWSYRQTSHSQENTSLSYLIDLRKVLPEWVTIGFSATTGALLERNILDSWEFNSNLVMKETNGTDTRKTKIIVSVTVSLGVLLVAALVMGVVVLRRRKQIVMEDTAEAMNLTSINDDLERGAGPRKFSYKDLATATNNFSDDRKLGDFGLARLMDHELGPQTTGLAGTLGYLAPECISTGRASKESDVYSFGVVAVEIATGRKSTDPMKEQSEMGLVEWVWDLYGSGKLLLAVDEKLGVDVDEKQVECLMVVGLWCAHPDRSFIPSIRQVIQVLNFETAMPNLPMKMPVPMYHIPTDPSVSSGEPFITNSSIEVGR